MDTTTRRLKLTGFFIALWFIAINSGCQSRVPVGDVPKDRTWQLAFEKDFSPRKVELIKLAQQPGHLFVSVWNAGSFELHKFDLENRELHFIDGGFSSQISKITFSEQGQRVLVGTRSEFTIYQLKSSGQWEVIRRGKGFNKQLICSGDCVRSLGIPSNNARTFPPDTYESAESGQPLPEFESVQLMHEQDESPELAVIRRPHDQIVNRFGDVLWDKKESTYIAAELVEEHFLEDQPKIHIFQTKDGTAVSVETGDQTEVLERPDIATKYLLTSDGKTLVVQYGSSKLGVWTSNQ